MDIKNKKQLLACILPQLNDKKLNFIMHMLKANHEKYQLGQYNIILDIGKLRQETVDQILNFIFGVNIYSF